MKRAQLGLGLALTASIKATRGYNMNLDWLSMINDLSKHLMEVMIAKTIIATWRKVKKPNIRDVIATKKEIKGDFTINRPLFSFMHPLVYRTKE